MEIIRKLKDGREIVSEVKPNEDINLYGDEVSLRIAQKPKLVKRSKRKRNG